MVGDGMDGRGVWNVAEMQMKKLISRVAVGIALLGAVVGVFVFVNMTEGQGQENSDCMRADSFSIPGPAGMTASGYTTVCSPPAASIVTYVYVHRSGQALSPNELVFRYSQRATVDTPSIRWVDAQHVNIEATHVETVSKMQRRISMISIHYEF